MQRTFAPNERIIESMQRSLLQLGPTASGPTPKANPHFLIFRCSPENEDACSSTLYACIATARHLTLRELYHHTAASAPGDQGGPVLQTPGPVNEPTGTWWYYFPVTTRNTTGLHFSDTVNAGRNEEILVSCALDLIETTLK